MVIKGPSGLRSHSSTGRAISPPPINTTCPGSSPGGSITDAHCKDVQPVIHIFIKNERGRSMEGLDIQKAVNLLAELLGEQEGYDIQVTLEPKKEEQEATA